MKKLYLTTALALLASPALADITPEELWESWQKISGIGLSVSAGEQTRQGNVLVLSDVKTEIDAGYMTYTQIVAEMRLEALPDGSVSVSYDSDYTGSAQLSIAGGFTNDITFTGQIEHSQGLAVGTAEDYIYNFELGRMHQTGKANLGVVNRADTSMSSIVNMKDISGQIRMLQADAGLNLTYSFSMGEITSSQNALSPSGNGREEIKQVQRMNSQGFSGEIEAFIPQGGAPDSLTLHAALALQSSSMSQKITSPRKNLAMELAQGPGTFTFLIDDQNYGLTINRQGGRFSLSSPQFGTQPYSTQVENTQLALTLPYKHSDTVQDASFALSLEGITVGDSIWAIVDPQNTLSHAPADFAISTGFKSTLLLDWSDIEAAKAWEGPIAILHQIKLDAFQVALENASLSGEGVVDFAMELPDAPVPDGGALSFVLTGIPALLEKLGGLPLVNPSIIAGAQGMLGVFTTAGEGDSLTSQIEFSEGGHVSINGVQVR